MYLIHSFHASNKNLSVLYFNLLTKLNIKIQYRQISFQICQPNMSLYYYFQILQSFLFLLLWLTGRPESSEAKGHAHVISNFKWPPLMPYLGIVLHPDHMHNMQLCQIFPCFSDRSSLTLTVFIPIYIRTTQI